MSGFDNLNSGFYQTNYSIDEQSQQSYDYGGSGGPYSKQYAGYDYSQQGRFVPPDMMQPQQTYTGQIYQPTQAYPPTAPQQFYGDSFEEEPPLLEELGINFDHIWQKTLTVLHPLRVADGSIMNETDLAGPVVFCLACLWSHAATGWQNPIWLRIWNQCNWMFRNVLFVKFNEYDRCLIWLCGKCPGVLSSSYDPAVQLCSGIFFTRNGRNSHCDNYWLV
ncbi:Protein YIPF5 [Lemmus lemmus]